MPILLGRKIPILEHVDLFDSDLLVVGYALSNKNQNICSYVLESQRYYSNQENTLSGLLIT